MYLVLQQNSSMEITLFFHLLEFIKEFNLAGEVIYATKPVYNDPAGKPWIYKASVADIATKKVSYYPLTGRLSTAVSEKKYHAQNSYFFYFNPAFCVC